MIERARRLTNGRFQVAVKDERQDDEYAILHWSTSATAIITALWLLALIPTLDLQSLRRVITISAGGLPVLFVVLGTVGMFWADVP